MCTVSHHPEYRRLITRDTKNVLQKLIYYILCGHAASMQTVLVLFADISRVKVEEVLEVELKQLADQLIGQSAKY